MSHTLVIGASEKADRYSNKAIKSLLAHKHTVAAVGAREGQVISVPIFKTIDEALNHNPIKVDTVTMYINPGLQQDFIEDIIKIKPKRVIFNPGTENPHFYAQLAQNNIKHMEACTLVLLITGQY